MFNCLFLCARSLKNTRSAPSLPLHTSHLTAICATHLDSQNMHPLSLPITFKQCFPTYLDREQNLTTRCLWLEKSKVPLNPLPTSIKSPIFNALLPFLCQVVKLMHDWGNSSLDKQRFKKRFHSFKYSLFLSSTPLQALNVHYTISDILVSQGLQTFCLSNIAGPDVTL